MVADGVVNNDEINITPISTVQLPLKVETLEHNVFLTLIDGKDTHSSTAEILKKHIHS